MPVNIVEHPKRSNYVRPSYIQMTPGIHVVRFLEPLEEGRFQEKHFIVTPNGPLTVKCLGDVCPLCQNNRKIYQLHPKDYADQKGYFARSDSYTFNVLDRTNVKVCPNTECQEEVFASPTYPPQCPKCHTMVVAVPETMSNKVKLLQLSRTACTQLNDVEKTQTRVVDGARVVIPVTEYDMVFTSSIGGNGKKVTTPIPATSSNDKVEVPTDALLNKDSIMTLTADEINLVLTGVTLKDIFSARKPLTVETAPETTLVIADQTIINDIQKKISELYGE